MASSSSRPSQQEYAFSGASSSDRPAFSGIEPPLKGRKVSKSSRLYDVFINHRGPDVKNTLALQLYKYLERLNIRAFLDSEEKELGESFPSMIENAIHSASVHIAIFSKGYAESPWCLEELVLILRSKAKIIPIFFDVEPSALRYVEKGVYGKAFSEYKNKKRYMEKLEEWKEALQSASFTVGVEFKSSSECESVISAVHKEVQRMRSLVVAKYPVGLPRLVERFQNQCINGAVQDFESQCGMSKTIEGKPKIVGIFGMGGVGKTTLSKELFNRKRSDRSRSCFLFDVREASAKNDLPSLQMKLLRELFDENDHPSFLSVEDGISCLSNRFAKSGDSSFLIVLDDINHQEQLDALLISDELKISDKSLVIVTTRDVGVLINAGITVGYHLKGMDTDLAQQLFFWHAFRQPHTSSGWEKLVDLFVEVCCGLPLSLQVLGSHVHGQGREFWELELKKVKKTLPQDIHRRLRISIDTLDDEERQIFIDIACFFIGESTVDALSVWEASGWSSQHALGRLKNKCLVEEIKSSEYRGAVDTLDYYLEEYPTVLRMHDHLRDLGRRIADEPRHPRRLWPSKRFESLESKGFEKILTQPRVRYMLYFENNGYFIKCFLGESENKAETSTALLWHEVCRSEDMLTNIPPWIPLQNLHFLRIENGSLQRYWQKDEQAPFALKELQILNSSELDLSLGFLTCLEKIAIHNCPNLSSLAAISDLRELVEFNISGCEKLEQLNLALHSCLKIIRIFNCFSLQRVSVSRLEKLVELNIMRCQHIKDLSLVRLSCLKKLKISDCSDLKSLGGMSGLKKLEDLQVDKCQKLEEISLFQYYSLENIRISDCLHLKSVAGMSALKKLVELQFEKCPKLEEISLFQLNCLEKIRIYDCPHPNCVAGISDLTKLVQLQIEKCPKLEEIDLFQLNCLENFRISDCSHLKSLARICGLKKLVELQIEKCPKLEEISFVQLSYLKIIKLSDCQMLRTLKGINVLTKLVELDISKCKELEEFSLDELGFLTKIKNCWMSPSEDRERNKSSQRAARNSNTN